MSYTIVCYSKRRTTKEIQDEHMAYMAQITKHLPPLVIEDIAKFDHRTIQSEELNFEQKEWRYFRMGRPFPKPYRPYAPIVLPLKWQEQEDLKT